MTNLVQSKPQSLILSNIFSVSNGLSFTFKLQPEAKAWISRGKMLLGKCIPVSTKYFDMAAKYVPANDKKLLVEVLCNRSDARQGSFDFEGALEDAKNVAKFAPELLKVYMACLFVRFCFVFAFFILRPFQRILLPPGLQKPPPVLQEARSTR